MFISFIPGGDGYVLHGEDTLQLHTTKLIILVPVELQDRIRLLSGLRSTFYLPVNINVLVNLRVIDISRCTNLASLPRSIWSLKSISILNVANTKISEIPNEIGCLESLRELNASNCQNIRTLPSKVFELKSLEKLNLAMTELCGLPNQIGELASLKELDLSWCKHIESVPATIGQLEQLEILNLYGTNLSRLPTQVGNLLALRNLDLSFNRRLIFLPPSIGRLSNLEILRLSYTKFSGSKDVGKVCGPGYKGIRVDENYTMNSNECYDDLSIILRTNTPFPAVPLEFQSRVVKLVAIQHDNLTQLPACVWNMKRMQMIQLSYCDNFEDLPEDFGELFPNLEVLDLGETKLSRLPDDIWKLSNLRVLNLNGCVKIQRLPIYIGWLTNLENLHLSRCINLFEIPESIGFLKSLRILNLSLCKRIERLPQTIGGLTKLEILDLLYNENLSKLPENISCLPNIRTLNLKRCEGLVALPVSFGRLLGTLEELTLSNTRISELPPGFGNNYSNLTSLDLSWCPNIRSIPPVILGQLNKLETLGLDVTDLQTRRFPEQICNLPRLVKLHLSLSVDPNLPRNIGDLNHLRELQLSTSPGLIDKLPPSIGLLKNLERLTMISRDLSHLPNDIDQQLPNLVFLDLWECPNIRSLPSSLGRLTNLEEMLLNITTFVESPGNMPTLENLMRLNVGWLPEISGNTNWRDLVKELLKNFIGSCPHLGYIYAYGCKCNMHWDRKEFFWFESILAARRARARHPEVSSNMWHHLISNPKSLYSSRFGERVGFDTPETLKYREEGTIPVGREVVYRALVEKSSNLLQAIVESRGQGKPDETEE